MTSSVLIVGATGATGRSATRELLQKGIKVRALVHKADDRSRQLEAQGAQVCVGDLLDIRSIRGAFKDIKRAYFVYPVRPGLLDATANFALAAKEAGVEFIVNMSQITARADAPSNAALNHWISERILDWCGILVVHLRPTVFHELLFFASKAIIDEGSFAVPFAAPGKFASVSTEDLGVLIATILSDPSAHSGQIYPLFGTIELTPSEIAGELGKALGKDIRLQTVSGHEFVQSFTGKSIPYLEQHFDGAAVMHLEGLLSGRNDTLEKLTGRRPQSLTEFVEKNQAVWKSR